MPIPKKPSTGPPQPANTKPAPKPRANSDPVRLRAGAKVPKGGPGQTWFGLMKQDVDEYLRTYPQSQEGKIGQSLLGKLVAAIRRLFKSS